jgi:hypothetical protein
VENLGVTILDRIAFFSILLMFIFSFLSLSVFCAKRLLACDTSDSRCISAVLAAPQHDVPLSLLTRNNGIDYTKR